LSRLLVVEDSPAIGLLLRRRLEKAGHRVEVVTGATAALERLDGSSGDALEVVLSDVNLPGIGGIELTDRIREGHPELPLILVTAVELEPGDSNRADAVIGKPIDFDLLLGTIERLAGRPG